MFIWIRQGTAEVFSPSFTSLLHCSSIRPSFLVVRDE